METIFSINSFEWINALGARYTKSDFYAPISHSHTNSRPVLSLFFRLRLLAFFNVACAQFSLYVISEDSHTVRAISFRLFSRALGFFSFDVQYFVPDLLFCSSDVCLCVCVGWCEYQTEAFLSQILRHLRFLPSEIHQRLIVFTCCSFVCLLLQFQFDFDSASRGNHIRN